MINLFRGAGMLTGNEIRRQVKKGGIIIDPYDDNIVNPNSHNVRLHPVLKLYDRDCTSDDNNDVMYYYNENQFSEYCLDMHNENKTRDIVIPESGMILYPGKLYIGRTVERIATDKFIPMINGRSSGGRLGLSIHICAGFGDIGFDGTFTLEITVVEPLKIYPYDEVAQICYFTPYGKVKDLYRGKYYKQEHATPSLFFKDYEKKINGDKK